MQARTQVWNAEGLTNEWGACQDELSSSIKQTRVPVCSSLDSRTVISLPSLLDPLLCHPSVRLTCWSPGNRRNLQCHPGRFGLRGCKLWTACSPRQHFLPFLIPSLARIRHSCISILLEGVKNVGNQWPLVSKLILTIPNVLR